ncbi:sulfotransferase-like domain-containing protein [Kordiimonas aestuarii]|uniref:sulfotransferase-like domain-containing protein n=1 Tax=Kordiimonas aestuarii TaxID=1005925 RepID=UPI0021D21793|nr:HAD family hydrolase [Kordiimonas aestuarii]
MSAPVRIAMWSGPRNISTAMMRSFENRADTVVVDEPLYATYLAATGIDHPGREEVLVSQSTDWRQIVETLTGPVPDGASVFYQKHMCHHMLPDMGRDWLEALDHAFLIRDPRLMLASYVKTREEVTLTDLGLEAQLEIFEREADKLGKAPPVIESADVLRNPEGKLRKLCAALRILFDDAMLSWPAGRRDSDGVWAPYWYRNVEASTGFMAPKKEETPVLAPHLARIADAAMPIYETLSRYRL